VDGDRDTAQDRVTIQEAARRLGVKEDAIRKRIQRGTLPHEKTDEGRVFVWVEATHDTTQDATEDAYQDAGRDQLLAELRDQVRFLREELARKDAILLNMTKSMRQLTAPQDEPRLRPEPPGAPEAATEQPGRVGPQTEVEGPEEAPEQPRRRSWWREFFGFDQGA
jgi:excisionase family DNA binding protein